MKKIFALLLLAGGLSAGAFTTANAQNVPLPESEDGQSRSEKAATQRYPEPSLVKTRDTRQDKRREKQLDEIRTQANAYNSNNARREQFKDPAPYQSESFTVTKFKETKTKRKLRKGEGRTRFSVPDPKGKPLKHKKKQKFLFFN
ncbi:MAG TPA: hypothetical protein VK927_07320 [Adhaeribacter sp.]|nr:hypothetical protein [Adhaeribacter sp.]